MVLKESTLGQESYLKTQVIKKGFNTLIHTISKENGKEKGSFDVDVNTVVENTATGKNLLKPVASIHIDYKVDASEDKKKLDVVNVVFAWHKDNSEISWESGKSLFNESGILEELNKLNKSMNCSNPTFDESLLTSKEVTSEVRLNINTIRADIFVNGELRMGYFYYQGSEEGTSVSFNYVIDVTNDTKVLSLRPKDLKIEGGNEEIHEDAWRLEESGLMGRLIEYCIERNMKIRCMHPVMMGFLPDDILSPDTKKKSMGESAILDLRRIS